MQNLRASFASTIWLLVFGIGCSRKSNIQDSSYESIPEIRYSDSAACSEHDVIVSNEVLIRDYVGSIDEAILRYGKPDSIIPSEYYGTQFRGVGEASVVLTYEKYNCHMYVKRNGDIIAILAIHRFENEANNTSSKTKIPQSPNGNASPSSNGGTPNNRPSAPRQPPEGSPPAKPGSAPR